jgi:hypothetical protein
MLAMTKRRLLRWSLILIALSAFAVWLEPTRILWGWLCGEAFCDGRPASWWRGQLQSVQVKKMLEHLHIGAGPGDTMLVERRMLEFQEPQGVGAWFMTKVLRRKLETSARMWGDFLFEDGAEEVLAVLLRDPDPQVREKADVLEFERTRPPLPTLPEEEPERNAKGTRKRGNPFFLGEGVAP